MLSSIFGNKKGSRHADRSPFLSPVTQRTSPITTRKSTLAERRRAAGDYESVQEDEDELDGGEEENEEENEDDEDGDGDGRQGETPLLPIFEASHLDALPVYNLTHTIRLVIVPRCETTLSWDQLRSPQVSQFLVKPMQQQILTSHFSRATLYALIANCLQFNKEIQMNPGNSGTSKTRALVCELLAIKLLKEYSTRELLVMAEHSRLDALSYDFYPLQGLSTPESATLTPTPNWDPNNTRFRPQPRVARISTLEIAIRAQAKRFLAHPLVVQQLEAIWAGTIVFHSSADNLHRPLAKVAPSQNRGYGAIDSRGPVLLASPGRLQSSKQGERMDAVGFTIRRSVTLYDPRDTSLFKLSRLRVPRYRQFLSTCSLAVLLGLFLAVLIERSLKITVLEVIFWFWSAGFMLDEIVGFNEQGFSLYILSFWNAFDLGILILFICYYCLRLYGILMPDLRKHHIADMAYDVLATNAVLLFPRLFSVLDHYRYFSQLLIAFRMMALDLVAVFILIVISCSGFFVAFSLSFGNPEFRGSRVAYALFQMIMGFTPAAWEQWDSINILGKGILTLFLFICHFLIVTILITVLTNSFMAIVQNANEEHQFVFAVNTISMVKSDALFSYIAPTNILAWLLTPLRYFLPFRQFVRLNRTVIKFTHFPILFLIYSYERMVLQSAAFEPTELIQQRGRKGKKARPFDNPGTGLNLFSPKPIKLREPSIATFQKDRALDEVFRKPFRGNSMRGAQQSQERRKTSNVVNNWMQGMGPEGTASPPQEQDHAVVDRLEKTGIIGRQPPQRRRGSGRDFTITTRSVASDPEDFGSTRRPRRSFNRRQDSDLIDMSMSDLPEQTDGDGDDELVTNDGLTIEQGTLDQRRDSSVKEAALDYFQQTPTNKSQTRKPVPQSQQPTLTFAPTPSFSTSPTNRPVTRLGPTRQRTHNRNLSTNTIVYNPTPSKPNADDDGSSSASQLNAPTTAKNSARNSTKTTAPNSGSGAITPATAGRRTPKRYHANQGAKPRPIMPLRTAFQSAPNIAGMLTSSTHPRDTRRPSSALLDIGSDLGDNKAVGGGFVGGMPGSLATQMMWGERARGGVEEGGEAQRRMGKLMLARMNGLEEGLRDVVREVKEWRRDGVGSAGEGGRRGKRRRGKGGSEEGRGGGGGEWVDEEVVEGPKGSSL